MYYYTIISSFSFLYGTTDQCGARLSVFLVSELYLQAFNRTAWMGDCPVARSLPIRNSRSTEKCWYKSMLRVGFEPTVVCGKVIANNQKLLKAGTEEETHVMENNPF
jgi:hypothetical protein